MRIGVGFSPEVVAVNRRFLAGVAFATPYNSLFILGPGDSRAAQGGGTIGTYGTGGGVAENYSVGTLQTADAFFAPLLDNKVRGASSTPNPGMGGQNAVQALGYPRPKSLTGNTGRIDNGTAGTPGNIFTLTATTGEAIVAGMVVYGPGITRATILPFGTSGTTGTGTTGTYAIDGAAQNVAANANIQIGFVFGMAQKRTIADTAANEAAIVIIRLGTNSSGSSADLTAIDNAIKALTNPAFVHPDYGAVLPLFGGQPKNIVLFNDTRTGVTTTNTANLAKTAGEALQFHNFAVALKRYDYASGDVTYANSRVAVIDSFDDPVMADLTDITTYKIKPGYKADGLHDAAPAAWRLGQLAAAKLGPLLPAYNYAKLPTASTEANFITTNPRFTTTTGGTTTTWTANGGTITGTPPAGWTFAAASTTGLNLDFQYEALGGDLGNALVLRITGTPTATATFSMTQLLSAGQRATINLATDTLRLSLRTKLQIDAGKITLASYSFTCSKVAFSGTSMAAGIGPVGNALGYGNNATFALYIKNDFATVEPSDYITWVTKNINAGIYGETGTPGYAQITAANIGYLTGVPIDVTLRIAQVGVAKVTD